MKKVIKYLVSLGMICVFGGVAFGDIIHVPGFQPTIQAGIDAAANGDTVLVADGVYTGIGNRDLDFGGKAITVQSENGPENCIINCESSGRGFIFQNGEGSSSVVSGLTIINGRGDGAGILCDASSPTITNLYINSNDAHSGTGGIACLNASSPTIKDSIIADNDGYGVGGIGCYSGSSPTISDCTINNNRASHGGGGIRCVDSSPNITGCIINGNQAGGDGGGILSRGSSAIINDCTISNNSADRGGGIQVDNGTPTITNCVISGNESETTGGGIAVNNGFPTITNCIISSNRANSSLRGGGGIYIRSASAIITNCTICNNTADIGGGISCFEGGHPVRTITNCIFWENADNEIHNSCGDNFTVSYSDVQGGYLGEGNMNETPLFMDITDPDPANWNLRLQSNSPCIDNGSNSALKLPNDDLDAKPRIIDGDVDESPIADMGAYEFGDICECDFDNDLVIDGVDLADYTNNTNSYGLSIFAADFARDDCPVYLITP